MHQMTHRYSCKRKTQRWPLVYFFNILDVSTIAARGVFMREFPDHIFSGPDDRGDFLRQVGLDLAANFIRQSQEKPTLSQLQRAVIGNILDHIEKKKPQNPKKEKDSCG
ncbi:PiggyBac transposable element-derived protein 4 [Elysia marginata]|uniref:PiggyBac transposable element-derived protein 4 n=1 Tax=Elysia marginata TaxID=1093978 RepID=A0AAV4FYI8_9GAST|nr:PiggyBac transposable element-derived protein 4 [Elysia marginata]